MDRSKKILYLQIGNIVAYLYMIILNAVSQTVKFNGQTNSSVSAQYPTRFTPAGYAFAIWTPIFAGLGLFAFYQALPKWRNSDEMEEKLNYKEGEQTTFGNFIESIGILFIINGFLNGTWGIIFAYEVFWLSVIVMLILLITLILIYIRLDIGITIDKRDISVHKNRGWYLHYWLVKFPFALYLGWICVATIANISIFFYADPIHWRSWQDGWSVVMQTVAFMLGCGFLYFRYDPVPPLVVVWALYAIASKQSDSAAVVGAALPLATVLAIFSLIVVYFRLKHIYAKPTNLNSGDTMYRV